MIADGHCEVWVSRSTNDGLTWDALRYAGVSGGLIGTGSGIKLASGRLLFPGHPTTGNFYSDDHGETYIFGGRFVSPANECQLAEVTSFHRNKPNFP